jgi:Zn-dependent peptidase ImmA (M78 family)
VTNPVLVELARVAAGLTQGQLAKQLGCTQPFISQVEHGERELPRDLAVDWASACGVPVAYLSRTEAPLSDALSGIIHRRMKTLPAKPFHRANAQVKLVALEVDSLFAEVDVQPASEIPDFPPSIGPADAAAAVRRAWRIPEGPIPNLVEVVESLGIPVILIDSFHEKQSATSHRGSWFDWMVALNANHPPSRQRFSLAHELGHIVLNHDASVAADDATARQFELDADAFAGALLMPRDDARRELRVPTFQRLIALKQRWRVSVAFLIRQAFSNGLIGADHRRRLEIELSSQPGGRRREPGEFTPEMPALIKRMIHALQSTGLSMGEIADVLVTMESTLRTRYLGERSRLQAVNRTPGPKTVLHLARP